MSNSCNVTKEGSILEVEFEKRLKARDADAFMQLFSEVSGELYRVAYIYLKNSEDARDVVQETAYRCFKKIGRLKNADYFRTWAVRTAINAALDMIKRNRRTVPLEDEGEFISGSPSPESSAEASVILEGLMNSLNEREKSVVIMRFVCGMSLEEISKATIQPLSTVKSTLYRALARMRKEDIL